MAFMGRTNRGRSKKTPGRIPDRMEGELLSLQWMEHSKIFACAIGNLRGRAAYTDATLACDGRFFDVHKFVLSTCSEYFNAIFEYTPCVNPVIVINNITCKELEALLDFMYIGEVSVRESQIPGVMQAAECLRVRGLAMSEDDVLKSPVGPKGLSEFEAPTKKRKRNDSRRSVPSSTPVHRPPPPLPSPSPVSRSPAMQPPPSVIATTSSHHFSDEQNAHPVVDGHNHGVPLHSHHQQQHQHHQPQHSHASAASPRTPHLESPQTPGLQHITSHQQPLHPSSLGPVRHTVTLNSGHQNMHTTPSQMTPQSPHTPQVPHVTHSQHTLQPTITHTSHALHITQAYTTTSHQPTPTQTPPTPLPPIAHITMPVSEAVTMNEEHIGQPMIPIDKIIQAAVKMDINTNKEELDGQPEDGIPELLNSFVDMNPLYVNVIPKTEPEEMSTSQNTVQNISPTTLPKPENNADGQFQCHFCDKKCMKKEGLTRHIQTKHHKLPYSCEECEFTTRVWRDICTHKKEAHAKVHKCPHCPFTSHRHDNVRRHMATHSDAMAKCPHCEYVAKRPQYLQRHIKNIHKKKEKDNPAAGT